MKRIIFLLSALLSLKAIAQNQAVLDSATRMKIMIEGYVNPNFSLGSFSARSGDGRTYTNDSLKGKASFMNFWFESCAPCMAEMDALNHLYNKFKKDKGFQFLSFTYENDEVISRIRKKYHIEYPILHLDPQQIYSLIFQAGFPTNMITDQSGKITYIKSGGQIDAKNVQAEFDERYVKQVERVLYAQ